MPTATVVVSVHCGGGLGAGIRAGHLMLAFAQSDGAREPARRPSRKHDCAPAASVSTRSEGTTQLREQHIQVNSMSAA
jgi:hypothetical protein